MNLTYTNEQELLRESIRKFFDKEVTPESVRSWQQQNGHNEQFWRKLAQAGWLTMAVPEVYGGMGSSFLDISILYEEGGRVLLPTTVYSTNFAALIIDAFATESQKQHYLPAIAAGECIATVAYLEESVQHNFNYLTTNIQQDFIDGKKLFVSNGQIANLIVVIGKNANGEIVAAIVSKDTPGITFEKHITFGGDQQSILTFNHVQAEVLTGKQGLSVFEDILVKATALQTAEMVGGMFKVIDMTTQYVTERKQFGAPIGSFQAVQHHLAQLATFRDASQLTCYQALSYITEGVDARLATSIAKKYANEAYKQIIVLSHQVWGGMGYSTEANLYLWSNRSKATELSFGTKRHHNEKIIRYLKLQQAIPINA